MWPLNRKTEEDSLNDDPKQGNNDTLGPLNPNNNPK